MPLIFSSVSYLTDQQNEITADDVNYLRFKRRFFGVNYLFLYDDFIKKLFMTL